MDVSRDKCLIMSDHLHKIVFVPKFMDIRGFGFLLISEIDWIRDF